MEIAIEGQFNGSSPSNAISNHAHGTKGTNSPAILSKLGAHILQVCVAHVINREDKQVLIALDTFADVGVQPSGLFLMRLFCGSSLVDDARALGTRHYERMRENESTEKVNK